MLHSHVRMAGVVLAALLALVGVAACGEDEGAAPPSVTVSTGTPTPTATADPAPAEPTLPAAATKPGRKGAIAFVTYYWDTVSYAQAVGDTATLHSLQAASCKLCSGGVDWIDMVRARGGTIDGGRHAVLQAHAFRAPGSEAGWIVSARVRAETTVVRGAGDESGRFPRRIFRVVLTLRYQDSAWRIESWSDR